jgi:hypothetical protein
VKFRIASEVGNKPEIAMLAWLHTAGAGADADAGALTGAMTPIVSGVEYAVDDVGAGAVA